MSVTKAILLPLLLIIISSCSDALPSNQLIEEAPAQESYPEVDRLLWPYFRAFEEEATRRDLDIDLRKLEITGVIDAIREDGVAGTCQYGQHLSHVTIDEDYWKGASAYAREMVVFHELGHCALRRGHTEGSDRNGSCLSLMNSGTTNCTVRYNARNKELYLDELFGSTH